LQLSFPPVGEFTLEREDLRGAGRGIESAFEAFRRRPFDLARDRLFRARLVTVDDSRCTLMLNLHHIITDWWSFDVLQGELAEAYRAAREGQAPRLSRPRIQYADFAAWQAELDASGVFGKRLEFWRRYLAQPPGALTVPGAPADAAEGIAQAVFQIDAGAAEAVRALARERNASVYVVLMAAFAVLAHRLSGAEDMVLGTPTANRSATGLERVMGYVMNAVPTRWRIRPDDSFGAVLARFLADFPDVMANADVPVGRIVSAAAPERRAGRSPLFQWVFMHLVPERSLRSLQEFAAPERIHTGGEHDLVGIVWDRDDGMEVSFEVRTEVFSAPVAARWAQAFAELLRQVAAAPEAPVSRHDLTPHAERARLLALSTGPAAPPWESLPDMLARHATATPDAPALVSGEVTLTYAQLVDRVDRLAGVLAQHAAAAERVVALALGRSAGFVIAALATLRAGAAYLPIDLDHPAEHLRHMLRETDPVLLVADREAELPTNVPTLLLDQRQILAGLPCEPLAAAPTLRADRAAYVIYTSGSTGRPKGVVVAHAGIPGLAHSFAERFGLGASDRILQHGSPGFDISVGEIAMAIASGAALVVAPPGPLAGPELGELLTSERVSFALLPPSVLGSVPDGDFPALRGVAVGAEVCPPGLVARWSASGRRFCNAYGPTESTVGAA
ncbi:MAG: condensation domain-containing protein, partial [Micromonosporaceae bacterium]